MVFVVPRPGAEPTFESLREFAKNQLASNKMPKRVVLCVGLPRTVSGKVQKFAHHKAGSPDGLASHRYTCHDSN